MSDRDANLEIRPAGPQDLERVREICREYADWLQVDYCLKDFEAELAGLPGAFTPPGGGLWLAWAGNAPAGCVALRASEVEPVDPQACEMRRLWVREDFRGSGLGRGLAETALRAARAAGYRRMVLETLGQMTAARALYAGLGFRAESRAYDGLDDDLRYMVCDLAEAAAVTA